MNLRQLRALLWLRTRLLSNAWSRGKGFGPVLAAMLVIGAVAVCAISLGLGVFVGTFAIPHFTPTHLMLVMGGASLVFLMFWTGGLAGELQRTELIELSRLMHLPVSLFQLFVLNYVASVPGLSTLLFLPGVWGFALGAAYAGAPAMLGLVPLSLAYVFALSAWTYWLQGRIAGWIQNPRRRRVMTTLVTLAMVLVFQGPNLFFNVMPRFLGARGPEHTGFEQLSEQATLVDFVGSVLPPLWLGAAAQRLMQREFLFPLAAWVALTCLGMFGLLRSYRATLQFYAGHTHHPERSRRAHHPERSRRAHHPERSRRAHHPEPTRRGSLMVEWKWPWVSDQTSAVAAATLRNLLRAPEALMAFASGLLFAGVMALAFLTRLSHNLPRDFAPLFVFGMLSFATLTVSPFVGNTFGFDRHGLRTFLLAPIPRLRLLVGKNLGVAPLAVGSGLVLLTVFTLTLRWPVLFVLAAVCQLGAEMFMVLTVGNATSVLVPHRQANAGLRRVNLPASVVLARMALSFVFFAFSGPAAVGPLLVYMLRASPKYVQGLANFFASFFVMLTMAVVWGVTLRFWARLFERNETGILAQVTADEE